MIGLLATQGTAVTAIATLFHSPLLFSGAVVLALALTLALSIRNEGWVPPFRQLRIRRALLLALLVWGLAVLTHPAAAATR